MTFDVEVIVDGAMGGIEALSLQKVEELLFDRGFHLRHEIVRLWRNRFGPMLNDSPKKRLEQLTVGVVLLQAR